MATIRSYSATFEHTTVANAALTRWRFNEDAGATTALDSVDAHDGSYETGAAPGDAGTIGDGAARFDGATGMVLVADTLTGTITVSAFGDSLIAGADIPDPADRFSPNLEAALEARGLDATVLNRLAVSGDTSAARPGPRRRRRHRRQSGRRDPRARHQRCAQRRSTRRDGRDQSAQHHRGSPGGRRRAVLLTGTFGFYPDRPAAGWTATTMRPSATPSRRLYAEIAGDTRRRAAAGRRRQRQVPGRSADCRREHRPTIRSSAACSTATIRASAQRRRRPAPQRRGRRLHRRNGWRRRRSSSAPRRAWSTTSWRLANGSIELLVHAGQRHRNADAVLQERAGRPSHGDIEILLDGDEVAVGMDERLDHVRGPRRYRHRRPGRPTSSSSSAPLGWSCTWTACWKPATPSPAV